MTPLRVGYLGPAGTFSEEAFLGFLAQSPLAHGLSIPEDHRQTYPQLSALFINAQGCDVLIAPLENSTEGPITETIDYLIGHPEYVIIQDLLLPVRLAFMVAPDFDPSTQTLKSILSHRQPLSQAQAYIFNHYPDAELSVWDSTASAAAYVAQHPQQGFAAIGSQNLAALYGLKILETNIQDQTTNSTRFVVLCTPENPHCAALLTQSRANATKISIVFTTPKDVPGSLVKALDVFAKRQINMCSVVSRPAKTGMGDYMFWVDINAPAPSDFEAALAELKAVTSAVKVVGCYGSLAL